MLTRQNSLLTGCLITAGHVFISIFKQSRFLLFLQGKGKRKKDKDNEISLKLVSYSECLKVSYSNSDLLSHLESLQSLNGLLSEGVRPPLYQKYSEYRREVMLSKYVTVSTYILTYSDKNI